MTRPRKNPANCDASAASYRRAQTRVLAEHMPEGFTLVPGKPWVAYRRISGNRLHLLTAKVKPETGVSESEVDIVGGMVYVKGDLYCVSDSGLLLPHALAQLVLDDPTRNMERHRKGRGQVLPGLPHWYELHSANKIRFHRYEGADEIIEIRHLRNNRVLYQGHEYLWLEDELKKL